MAKDDTNKTVERLSVSETDVTLFSDESVTLFSDPNSEATTLGEAKEVFIGHAFWYKQLLPASIFAAGVLVGGYSIFRNFCKYQNLPRWERKKENYEYRLRPSFFKDGLLDGWLPFGLFLTYTISVIAVLVLAFFLPVTLPYMWYSIPASTNNPTTSADNYRQGTPTYEEAGRLLGHSNGYWYAISHPICYSSSGTRFTKTNEYYRSIMAIPDKNVKDVEVLNRG
jgi:hypothetical protein